MVRGCWKKDEAAMFSGWLEEDARLIGALGSREIAWRRSLMARRVGKQGVAGCS